MSAPYLTILETLPEWGQLKQSQREFVLAMAETGFNQSRALTLMGRGKGTASKMMARPDVAACLRAITALAAERSGISLEGHLDEMARLRDVAEKKGQMTAAVTAEAWRGRAAGFYEHKDQGAGKRVPSDDEIADALSAKFGVPRDEVLRKLRGTHAEKHLPPVQVIEAQIEKVET